MSAQTRNGSWCKLCHKPIAQGEATGVLEFQGKRYPSVNSPDYDDRYGAIVHQECLEKHYQKRAQREKR